jgi:putative tryptophan/tyrosine transport system substrate-binding protein
MIAVLKKIALGVALIAISAAILLYSDLASRRVTADAARSSSRQLRVAIVQHADIPTLDDGILGALAALKERGYDDGGRISVRRYNAQGDIGTANAIAKEVTSSDYDLIFSVSTISLQTIANANRFSTPPRTHVFSLVSDPYAAGVGVSRENHLQHPAYMTGYGSMAPVEDAFKMARQLNPGLKRVGLVWDPSEANSVATTTLARSVCAKLGLTLVEANAENSTAIGDAVGSLFTRSVDAIWISPDLVAAHGLDLIVSKARTARIPVFTSVPRKTPTGALFELGANYFATGHTAGELAADVLEGRSPASIPVENIMPVTFQVNKLAVSNLRDKWTLPESVLAQADVVQDETGRHQKNAPSTASVPSATPAAAGSR